MKNATPKILTLCIGAALTTMVHSVQADETTAPKFYGMFYLTLDHQDLESKAEKANWALNSRSSRLGVMQDISLQNGLTALYKIEYGFDSDDGNSGTAADRFSFSARDVYAGVKGDFGQVIAGRLFNTPLRATEGKIDPFNFLQGDIAGVLGGQNSAENAVQYSTPTFNSTVATLAFMPGENKDIDGDGKADRNIADAFSGSVVYSQGNLYAALAADLNMASGTATDVGAHSNRVQLAGQYQLGATALGAIVQYAQDSDDSKLNEMAALASVTHQIQNYKLKAQAGFNKGDKTDFERMLYAVGVDYSLDKAAMVTVDYGAIDIDKAATAPATGKVTKTDSVFTLGYQLKF
ncbi:MAG: hypothetical protein RL217_1397 [Pseudomonadota bacterium]|jgi:predicted porin